MRRGFFALCVLCVAIAAAPVCARAEQDQVEFFRNIHVTPDEPVQNAVCFFCNVSVQGVTAGDIVVFFGSVRLDGQARQDVVDFFGHIAAADNSTVGGDLVSFFGSVRLGEDVTVHKDTVAIFGTVRALSSDSFGGDRVAISPWTFFGPLLVLILIVYVIVHELSARRQRRFMQQYPLPPRR